MPSVPLQLAIRELLNLVLDQVGQCGSRGTLGSKCLPIASQPCQLAVQVLAKLLRGVAEDTKLQRKSEVLPARCSLNETARVESHNRIGNLCKLLQGRGHSRQLLKANRLTWRCPERGARSQHPI